jgi:hypothetical protein
VLLAAGADATSSHAASVYVTLAVCGLFAWRGYYRALGAERATGRSPYGWEPTTWSIVCFCLTIVGRVLLESAINRAPAPAPGPAWVPPVQDTWAPPVWSAPAAAVVAEPVAPDLAASAEAPPAPAPAPLPPSTVQSAPRALDVLPRF